MFGEENILGQCEKTVDEKHRIIIPSFTKSEKGDKLILLYDKEFDVYRIFDIEQINKKYEELSEKLKAASNDKEEKRYEEKLLKLSRSILKVLFTDGQKRINLTDKFEPNAKVYCVGANDHLILELKK